MSIYLVPSDSYPRAHPHHWAASSSTGVPSNLLDIIIDTDIPRPHVHSLDAYGDFHPSSSRSYAIAQARARHQVALRAEAERQHAAYWEAQLRRQQEEQLLRQRQVELQRQRQLESQRREYLRQLELARLHEAHRREAEEYQRRRRAAIEKARSERYQQEQQQQLEHVLGHFLASAFEGLFDKSSDEAGPSVPRLPVAHQAEAPQETVKEAPSQPSTSTQPSTSPQPSSSTPPVDSAADTSSPRATSSTPSSLTVDPTPVSTTPLKRSASPTPSDKSHVSHASGSSSRSSSRGRSRQPRVRDVDENGEEIVLPEDQIDEDGEFVEVTHV